jgi:hypothetical protein
VNDLGRFEIGRAIVARLEQRGLRVSQQLQYEVEKRATDATGLPRMLERLDKVTSAEQILVAAR